MWHDVTQSDPPKFHLLLFNTIQCHTAKTQVLLYNCISTIREKAMPARYSRLFAWIPKSVFPRIHNHLAFATWFRQRTLSSGHHTQLPGHGKDLAICHWGIGASGQIPQDSRARCAQDITRLAGRAKSMPSFTVSSASMQSHAEPCRAMQETWKRNENEMKTK